MSGKSGKSAKRSKELRFQGNEFFKKREFMQALVYYNKSLCYAPNGSEEMAHAFNNRSAVYKEAKFYEKCLVNIQQALDNNYPRPEVLKDRKAECLKKLRSSNQSGAAQKKPTLSYPEHEKFSFIASCLHFRRDSKGNPHVYSNLDLQVGDVIAIAEPFSAVVSSTDVYVRCNYCLRDNLMDLYPCSSCSKGNLSSDLH